LIDATGVPLQRKAPGLAGFDHTNQPSVDVCFTADEMCDSIESPARLGTAIDMRREHCANACKACAMPDIKKTNEALTALYRT